MSQKTSSANSKLSNDQYVLRTLKRANGPLSAYQILDHLKVEGIAGPPTVYRALDKLINRGLVHRIETLNAYVPCREHPHCTRPVFTICESCGAVSEFSDSLMQTRLQQITERMGFGLRAGSIEVRGSCADCRANGEKIGTGQ